MLELLLLLRKSCFTDQREAIGNDQRLRYGPVKSLFEAIGGCAKVILCKLSRAGTSEERGGDSLMELGQIGRSWLHPRPTHHTNISY